MLGQEILAQQLLVQMEDNRRLLMPASDVLSVLKRPRNSEEPRQRDVESETPKVNNDEMTNDQ